MKRFSFILMTSILLMASSCQKEDPSSTRSRGETGWLQIDIGLSLEITELSNTLKSTAQTEDFKVSVYDESGVLVTSFESVSALPDAVELEVGSYYVEAHSDNNLPAMFENPYYFGASGLFSISSGATVSVEVTCQLANTMVSVHYSETVSGSFSDYSTTVSTAEGSLVYVKDEMRTGYFKTLPMEIQVDLTYQNPDGSDGSKTISGSIADPLPNRHYEVHVDASPADGQASFQVLLDETPIPVEVVELGETPSVPAGAIAYGELLITEIMYDPASLSDTEGEWFEIYNNSGRTIQLQNLVLTRDDLNSHVISDPIELPPSGYVVLQRTAQATSAAISYIYGSDITLSNTGATLSILNEGTGTGPGSVIFSVDYGDAAFPGGSGSSIGLHPASMNPADAISGSNWCTSSSAYTTGDLGTPGSVNDACW
jgi:hypothetical protein